MHQSRLDHLGRDVKRVFFPFFPTLNFLCHDKSPMIGVMSDDKRDSAQAKRFAEAARKAGCDESEDAFERRIKKLAAARAKKDKADEKPE